MTINEANLLLTLFYTQHKGKRLCDVIPNSKPYIVIHSYNSVGGDIYDEDGYLCLWYTPTKREIHREVFYGICYDTKYETINLLDYILFEDRI